MHILIIEFALTGHHSGYMERISAAYIEVGHSVTVTVLERDAAHPVINRLKLRFRDAFNVVQLADASYKSALHSRLGEIGRELKLRQLFGQAYRAVHQTKPVDYVFLPYLDYCLYALGLLNSPFGITRWGGICMRPSFHYGYYGVIAPKPKFSIIKQALFLRLLRSKTLKSIYTIDELLHRFVVERYSPQIPRLQYVPDPAELKGNHSYESARQSLGIRDDAVVVLVYGALDKRKGIDSLVAAVASGEISKNLQLLIVGKQSEWVKNTFTSAEFKSLCKNGRCHVIDDFVDESIQQLVFAGSDIIWLGYREHYTMSGVLVLAGITGKPVLATREGLIGWYVKSHGVGQVFDVENIAEISSAINKLTNASSINMPGWMNVFEKNNWEFFLKKLSHPFFDE